MLLLLFFAFISGLATILAPCIWPLLPIILSSAIIGKDHKRPLGITLGIMLSFAAFTLSISFLVKLFHFDPNNLRFIAITIIAFLGLTMIIPQLTIFLELLLSRVAGVVGTKGQKRGGFIGGFIAGLSLGIVWSPCAGPILAAIAALAAMGQVSGSLILVTIVYVMGVGIPLFAFAYGGQQFITKARGISRYTPTIQKVFGVIMILTAIAMYTNYDKYIQAKLLDAFPSLSASLTNFESNPEIKKQLDTLQGKQSKESQPSYPITNALFNTNIPAREFAGITTWLQQPDGKNSEKSLTIKSLKGKVVLIDFWTYTCINCIRTLPHVTQWYDTYHDQGFTVIGVHTPEFEFEKKTQNVQQAIAQYNIHYPVAQDNDYATWNAFDNHYWPAEYLIDANGIIRRTHFGEGEYTEMEQAIKLLLKEAGYKVDKKTTQMPDETPRESLSQETYIGSNRVALYYPDRSYAEGKHTFTLAPQLPNNLFALGGKWDILPEYAITGQQSVLEYNFTAQKVFLVLRPGNNKQATIKVWLDKQPISQSQAGDDVKNSILPIDQDRLYNLVNLHGKTEKHLLRLEFQTPGVQVYAFTFG